MIRVAYPVPNENEEVWETFKPFVQRFVAGWWQFPPGIECELVPVLFAPDHTGKITNQFAGLPIDQFELYRGDGADIGAAQWVADASERDDFVVALTSRVYFHRAGWLNHMAQARQLYGKGLYGTSSSREGGKLHCCTRCYGMDAYIWQNYPTRIDSRDLGTYWEVGMESPIGSISDWVNAVGLQVNVVYWEGVRPLPFSQIPDNIFRRGNQEQLLVFDKHTDAWFKADDSERRRLTGLCYGVDNPLGKA